MLVCRQQSDIFAPCLGKSTQTIEALQLRVMRVLEGGDMPQPASAPWLGKWGEGGLTGQLFLQRTPAGYQNDPRRRIQEGANLIAHQVDAHGIDGSLRQLGMKTWPGLAAAHGRVDAILQILHIGGGMLIDDHQVDGQTLHAQIFMGQQQFTNLRQILNVVNAQQHDGQIPGNGLLPEG